MKTMPLALTLILLFLLAACGGRQAPDNDGRTAAASPDAQAEGATRAAPDDDHDDHAKDHLEVAPDVQKRLGIAVAPVASQPLAIALRATGSVHQRRGSAGNLALAALVPQLAHCLDKKKYPVHARVCIGQAAAIGVHRETAPQALFGFRRRTFRTRRGHRSPEPPAS